MNFELGDTIKTVGKRYGKYILGYIVYFSPVGYASYEIIAIHKGKTVGIYDVYKSELKNVKLLLIEKSYKKTR